MSSKDNADIINYLIDIKTDIAVIKEQLHDYGDLKEEVKKHGVEIVKFQTSLRVLRGLLGGLLFAVPTALAAVVKILKG